MVDDEIFEARKARDLEEGDVVLLFGGRHIIMGKPFVPEGAHQSMVRIPMAFQREGYAPYTGDTLVAVRVDVPSAPGKEFFRAMRVRDLHQGHRALLYDGIQEITGRPYEDGLRKGMVRLPMIWGGSGCAPPEWADALVPVQLGVRLG